MEHISCNSLYTLVSQNFLRFSTKINVPAQTACDIMFDVETWPTWNSLFKRVLILEHLAEKTFVMSHWAERMVTFID
jgi:hypothetical protein